MLKQNLTTKKNSNSYDPVYQLRFSKNNKKFSFTINNAIYKQLKGFPTNNDFIKSHFEKHEQIRPIKTIDKTSPNGTPQRVITPGGTPLKLKFKYGVINTYGQSSSDSSDGENKLKLDTETIKTSHQYVKKPDDSTTKQMELTLNWDSFQKIKKDKAKRAPSQNRVMAEEAKYTKQSSANKIMEKLGANGKDWEWLHLIAFMLMRNNAQTPGNLVIGTAGANTSMLLIESQIERIIKECGEVKLVVTAELIEGTQIAKSIDYQIITEKINLEMNFNALKAKNPDRKIIMCFDALMATIIEHSAKELAVNISMPAKAGIKRARGKLAPLELASKLESNQKETEQYDDCNGGVKQTKLC